MIEAITQMTIEANKVIEWLNEGIRAKELTQREIIEGLPLLCVHLLEGNPDLVYSLISVMLGMID